MQLERTNRVGFVVRGVAALALVVLATPLSQRFLAPLVGSLSLNARLALSIFLTPVILVAIMLVTAPRPLWQSLGLRRVPVRFGSTLGAAAALIVANFVLIGTSTLLFQRLHVDTGSARQALLKALLDNPNPALRWLFFGFAALLAPVTEELFFRGLVYSSFSSLGTFVARAVSALTFAFIHREPLAFLGFAVVGWYLSGLRARWDSVWPGVAVHALYNTLLLSFAFLTLGMHRGVSP